MLCIPFSMLLVSLIMLFDTAESRHLCMQVVSLTVNMLEKPKISAVVWW